MPAPTRHGWGLLVFSLLVLAGCASSRDAAPDRPDAPAPVDIENLRLADFETFDPAPYEEAEPDIETGITHDVPEVLMANQAGSDGTRVVQGFRIQVYSAQDRDEANEQLAAVLDWWEALQESENLPSSLRGDLPVDVEYKQPYYRVRVGNFTSRAQAAELMDYLDEAFPQALIVPDEIRIR